MPYKNLPEKTNERLTPPVSYGIMSVSARMGRFQPSHERGIQMKFDAKTPRNELTIEGFVLSVPAPFTEGHVCTANEAGSLNQTLRENVRNNFAAKAKAAKEKGTSLADLQKDLDAYVGEYEFGRHTGGGARLDPVEREMRDIAEAAVLQSLTKKGIKRKDVSKEQLKELVDKALAEHGPKLRQKAEAAVKARSSALSGLEL